MTQKEPSNSVYVDTCNDDRIICDICGRKADLDYLVIDPKGKFRFGSCRRHWRSMHKVDSERGRAIDYSDSARSLIGQDMPSGSEWPGHETRRRGSRR